jgi:hypothetical protein
MILRGRVGGSKLGGEVGQIGESQLARVGAITDAKEADVIVDGIAFSRERYRVRILPWIY